MRKASRIMFIIGFVSATLALTFLVVMTVVSFMISSSGYKQELIRQLNDGSLVTTFSGTTEEKADQIQHLFLVMAIIFLLLTLFTGAALVIANIARHSETTLFDILTSALGLLSGNVFFILAGIFLYVACKQEEETISVEY